MSRENENTVRILYVSSVWIISIIFGIVPVMVLAFGSFETWTYTKMFTMHCFQTFPVISIIIMWGSLLRIAEEISRNDPLNSEMNLQSVEELNHRRIVKVVHRLVIALLICYIPFVCWRQYFCSIIYTRYPYHGYTNTVSFDMKLDNSTF